MKRFNIVAILLLLIASVFTLAIQTKPQVGKATKIARTIQKKNLADSQLVRILTPDPKTVLGSSISANMRTFSSQDGGYTITYPASWTPSTNEQIQGFNGDVSVFTTGPVGEKVLGYPSFIQIAVDENPNNISIDEFTKKHYGDVILKSTSIGTYSAEMTAEVQGPAKNIIYLIKQTQKIYQIRFYDGAAPKISKEELTKVLKNFTLLQQNHR